MCASVDMLMLQELDLFKKLMSEGSDQIFVGWQDILTLFWILVFMLYMFSILLRSFELTSAKCKHARILKSSQFTSFPCLSCHGGCHGMNLQLSELSLEVNSSMAARHGAFLRVFEQSCVLLRQRDVTC